MGVFFYFFPARAKKSGKKRQLKAPPKRSCTCPGKTEDPENKGKSRRKAQGEQG
jgi:hypothetical protein